MGKYSTVTKVVFFVFLGACVGLILSYNVYNTVFLIISNVILTITGVLSAIFAFRDVGKPWYSKGTKIFFIFFICCLGLIVFGLLDSLVWWYSWYGYPLIVIGMSGGLLTGAIFFILRMRDRSKPPQRGFVPQYDSAKPINIVELRKLLGITTKVTLQDVVNTLLTTRAMLLKFIAENQNQLPAMKIEGEYILLDPEMNEWVCPACGSINYGSNTICKECKTPFKK